MRVPCAMIFRYRNSRSGHSQALIHRKSIGIEIHWLREISLDVMTYYIILTYAKNQGGYKKLITSRNWTSKSNIYFNIICSNLLVPRISYNTDWCKKAYLTILLKLARFKLVCAITYFNINIGFSISSRVSRDESCLATQI